MKPLPPWDMKRETVAKTEADTDETLGHDPYARPMSLHIRFGMVNLDKPSGPSSHEVVAWVKRMLGLKHAGHGGTLDAWIGGGDPKVTGVLPVAFEDATKVVQAFLLSGKEYVCLMQLHEDMAEQRIRDAFAEFTGEIFQRPPLRASVKRVVRRRTIYSLDILEIDGRRVLFKVACQAGTYVRKICSDLGEVLGCGAHMSELRRTRAGSFGENRNLCSMYDLLNAHDHWKIGKGEEEVRAIVRPMEEAFEFIPKIYIRDSAVDAICHGADLAVPGVVKLDQGIATKASIVLMSLKAEVVALARALMSTKQIVEQDHGIAAKTVRVIMPPGTYPPLWKKTWDTKP